MSIVDGTEARPLPAGPKQDMKDQGNNEALTSLYMCMAAAEDTKSPVLSKKSFDPVVTDSNAGILNIKLVSPCDLMPIENFEPRVANAVVTQCKKAYKEVFPSKLEKLCPQPTIVFHGRERREFITFGIIFMVMMASASIETVSRAVSRTCTLETRQEELKQALDNLEKDVEMGKEKLEFLQSEVQKVTSILDQLVADFILYRENIVELQ